MAKKKKAVKSSRTKKAHARTRKAPVRKNMPTPTVMIPEII